MDSTGIDAKPVAGYFRVSLARDNMKAPEFYEDDSLVNLLDPRVDEEIARKQPSD